MDKKIIYFIIVLILLLWAVPSNAVDRKTLIKKLTNHEARSPSTWSELVNKDFKERVIPAPDIIIEYLHMDNLLQGFKERPKKAVIDEAFFSDIIEAITELPQSVRNHFSNHLAAIFLVEELGGTAIGQTLKDFDESGHGFLVIDIGSLSRKANEWATWKENSPFANKGIYTIEAVIEHENENTRKAAIQYILLHEIGHFVGLVKKAHPYHTKGGDPQNYSFSKLSWLLSEDRSKAESRFDNTFTNRGKIRYYSFKDAQLTCSEIDATYGQLITTDFVSGYAATNVYDDFAETYAMYVHVVIQNKPWEIRILKEGKTVRSIMNPILDKRCEAKKRYLDAIFE